MRAFFATPAEALLLFPPEEIPKLGSLQLDDDKLAYLYKLMNFKNIMTGRTNIELICADGENKLPWDRCFCSTLNKLDPFPTPPNPYKLVFPIVQTLLPHARTHTLNPKP